MDDGIPTTEQLVSDIIEELRANPDTDQVLIDILSEHVVKMDPKSSAVADAATLIENLARQRGEQDL